MTKKFSMPTYPMLDIDAITREQSASLLTLAGKLIAHFVHHSQVVYEELFSESEIGPLLTQYVHGVFTTLKRGKQLRGCCGSIGVLRPLGELLLNASRRTALHDKRMVAISPTELPYLSLDISLLHRFERIEERGVDRRQAFAIGKHGLHIQRGQASGLLLPSVSVEQGWDAEEFLQGVCRKAGLAENDWLQDDCQLQRFAGYSIHGGFEPSTFFDGRNFDKTTFNGDQCGDI